ncbi:MAG: hypothetical protein ACTSSJ_00215 [Candidatus Odinarchaeia archaeon]
MSNSKELVKKLFEGKTIERVPFQFEWGDPEIEYMHSDVIGISFRLNFTEEFYIKGGPFYRGKLSLKKWAESFDLEKYQWPDIEETIDLSRNINVAERYRDKFIVAKILGPTETAESFCAPPQDNVALKLHQITHNFGFAMLTLYNEEQARYFYQRICKYVHRLVAEICKFSCIDAVRIADDAYTYSGPLYPRKFIDDLYISFHKRIAQKIKSTGKYAILHCDGDMVELAIKLQKSYQAFHPLDLVPKATKVDIDKWVSQLKYARSQLHESIFFTGIPVELLYRQDISLNILTETLTKILAVLGAGKLIVSTTHRPYPGIKYDSWIKNRIKKIRKFLDDEYSSLST